MSAGEAEPPLETGVEGPEGLLFTGDAIRALKPEQIAAIGEFASRMFGVEVRRVQSVEQELGEMGLAEAEEQAEPVMVTYEDVRAFGREHDFADQVASRAWSWARGMSGRYYTGPAPTAGIEGLPPIEMAGPELNLNSVYDHVSHAMRIISQDTFSGGVKRDQFLIALLNELVQPETPLPTTWPRGPLRR